MLPSCSAAPLAHAHAAWRGASMQRHMRRLPGSQLVCLCCCCCCSHSSACWPTRLLCHPDQACVHLHATPHKTADAPSAMSTSSVCGLPQRVGKRVCCHAPSTVAIHTPGRCTQHLLTGWRTLPACRPARLDARCGPLVVNPVIHVMCSDGPGFPDPNDIYTSLQFCNLRREPCVKKASEAGPRMENFSRIHLCNVQIAQMHSRAPHGRQSGACLSCCMLLLSSLCAEQDGEREMQGD